MTDPTSESSTPVNPVPGRPRPAPFFDRRKLRAMRLAPPRRGMLGGMRIRKKLVVLHTAFSLSLAALLMLALWPALGEVVRRAESGEARELLNMIRPSGPEPVSMPLTLSDAQFLSGTAGELGIAPEVASEAVARAGISVDAEIPGLGTGAVVYRREGNPPRFDLVVVRMPEVRAAVTRLYVIVIVALLAAYLLVVVALEALVLPRSVYEPIRRMYAADLAVQDGRLRDETIPEEVIPSDELGEIMRSRNQTVRRLRQHEAALADALGQLEAVATDLKRKNHLLEAARRNLADADRLASLGMMSAGIAHELNTPLSVLKGLVEELNGKPEAGVEPTKAALMLRVVGRLERLSDALLDFARVRPPHTRSTRLQAVVQEAVTLVSLDRSTPRVEIVNAVAGDALAECDPDRMVQVFVNLIRNAADAMGGRSVRGPRVEIASSAAVREGRGWLSITITDNGPGIDPAVLSRLFEPFASTRLDARGTGLGLAVSDGIVREHGGLLLARNRTDGSGAVFEVMLPMAGEASALSLASGSGGVGVAGADGSGA